jgi:hypothetical protein
LNISSNKYFNVLEIAPTTDKAKIKKAFRKLAFKYHPDVNSSKEAHLKFIEITEAYKVCIGERIVKSNGKTKTQKTPEQDREERMQRAREFYRQSKIREEKENRAYFESLTTGKNWQFLKVFGVISAIFALLLLLDFYSLPTKDEKGIITSFEYNSGNVVTSINNNSYYIDKDDINIINNFSKYVVLKRSFIFNDVKKIKFIDINNNFITVNPQWTVFNLLWLFIALFLLPIFVLVYKKQTALFTFIYAISLYAVPIVFFIVLITRSRFGLV